MADISIETVRANELTSTSNPSNGQSFVMIDRNTNEGYLISYNQLVDSILSKIMSDTMPEDGLKMFIVGN